MILPYAELADTHGTGGAVWRGGIVVRERQESESALEVHLQPFVALAVAMGRGMDLLAPTPVNVGVRPPVARRYRCPIPPDRIREIVAGMTGFVYYINVAGVTGARRGLPADYPQLMKQVKSLTSLPVASGFGIADAETAAEAARYADGVISGSGFVKALASGVEEAAEFVRMLATAIN